MKTKDNIDELLAKHFASEAMTDAQMEELNQWIEMNYDEYAQIKQLMEVEIDKNLDCFDTEKAWKKVEKQLEEKTDIKRYSKKKISTYTIAAISAVAAVVAIVITIFSTSDNDTQTLYANNGTSVKELMLPDSSSIDLYGNSKLTYNDGKDRNVKLEGSAFFSVRKDGRHFIIEVGSAKVEVLGTSFLIKSGTKGEIGVYVKTGRVRVSSGKHEIVLKANEKAEIGETIVKGEIKNADEIFADCMTIKFDNTPIKKAVEIIKKKTGVTIKLSKGVENNAVTTQIKADDISSIASELAIICGCRCDTLSEGKLYRLYYE